MQAENEAFFKSLKGMNALELACSIASVHGIKEDSLIEILTDFFKEHGVTFDH